MLTPATKAAWTSFVEKRCRTQPEVPKQSESAACDDTGGLETELRACKGAEACLAVARRAYACMGRGGGPLPPYDPVGDTLARVMAEDCDGVLDAFMRSPSGEAAWWVTGPTSDEGRACITRSTHPHARRLMVVRGGRDMQEHLLDDTDATAAWMDAWLRRLDASPAGFLEALNFWRVFDELPRDRKVELVPALRRVARMEFLDTWDQRGWRHEALHRLGQLGDVESIPTMRAALGDSRNWWLQTAGAVALGEMGPAARSALEDLTVAAAEHWSVDVRAFAGRAAEQVKGMAPPELDSRGTRTRNDPGYPQIYAPVLGSSRSRAYRSYEPSSVVVDGERVEFEPQWRPVAPLPKQLESFDLAAAFPDAPGIRSWRTGLTAVERVGGGWVLGTSMGEFGGGAWFVTADGRAQFLFSGNIVGVVEFGGSRYLLQGLGHLGTSEGSVLRMEETAEGVTLRRMLELPAAPYNTAVVGEHLIQATRFGVVVVSRSFEFELLPYATRRSAPSELPSGYEAAVLDRVEQDYDAVQRCVGSLEGLTERCSTRAIPAGVSLWFDVNAAGTVTAVVPFEARDEEHHRPPTPEVTACIAEVARAWTLPPLDSGWTTFGLTLEPD